MSEATQRAPVIELWGAHTPRTLRPIWLAEELALRSVLHPIGPRTGETRAAAFTKRNPRQKIPLLVTPEIELAESLAICRFLLDGHCGGELWRPATRTERACVAR